MPDFSLLLLDAEFHQGSHSRKTLTLLRLCVMINAGTSQPHRPPTPPTPPTPDPPPPPSLFTYPDKPQMGAIRIVKHRVTKQDVIRERPSAALTCESSSVKFFHICCKRTELMMRSIKQRFFFFFFLNNKMQNASGTPIVYDQVDLDTISRFNIF